MNTLAETHPEILKQWDYENNIDVSPNSITAGSNKNVWWKCEKG